MAFKILNAVTANGTSAAVSLPDFDPAFPRYSTLYAYGNWGASATVAVEVSPDGQTWFPVNTFNANSYFVVSISFSHIRATVANANGSTSLNLIIT